MKIKLDPKTLTFGDMEDFESYTGKSLTDALSKGDGMGAKEMLAIVWICGRIDNPAFTIDDARKLPLGDLEVEVTADDADPTPGDG